MLSIVIVNWNTRELLRQCLRSVFSYPPSEGVEVIVVDNASEDDSAKLVAHEFGQVKLIANSANVGYAAGNNMGIEQATGELILTLNPDTEFFDDSLQVACELIRSQSVIGVLSGKLLNRDNSHQKSIRGFPKPWDMFFEMVGLSKLFTRSSFFTKYRLPHFDYDSESEVVQPMGTFLIYKKSVLDLVGKMDEQFPIFFNEVDLLMRIRREGFKTLYSPRIRLYHEGGASTRQIRPSMIWESHRSYMRFYKKWYWNRLSFITYPVLYAMVTMSAFFRARGWNAGFRP